MIENAPIILGSAAFVFQMKSINHFLQAGQLQTRGMRLIADWMLQPPKAQGARRGPGGTVIGRRNKA